MTDIGRAEYTDEQYRVWLDEMIPFLKIGYSLYYAMDKSLLLQHKDSIYRKYRLNDWFCEKIDAYRQYPGEIVNSIFTRLIVTIDDKMKQGVQISDEEWRNARFFAEKHRSCQPFFITRHEVLQVEPKAISGILDRLEQSDHEDLDTSIAMEIEKIKTQTAPLQVLSNHEQA